MLPGMVSPVAGRRTGRMIDVINRVGLSSGLKLCLDAGDIASVTSSSATKWLDRSGNGYDFYRGSGSGSDSADPTFNGAAGGQSKSEFYSSDGGDYFTYDTTNESWMNNIHKNSARFTLAFWAKFSTSIQALAGTINSKSEIGFQLYTDGAHVVFTVGPNAGAVFDLDVNTGSDFHTGAWKFIALSVNEASNSYLGCVNATTFSGACTYTSPSSSAATNTLLLGALPAPVALQLGSGDAFGFVGAWEGTHLTAANLTTLYGASRSKFGV